MESKPRAKTAEFVSRSISIDGESFASFFTWHWKASFERIEGRVRDEET